MDIIDPVSIITSILLTKAIEGIAFRLGESTFSELASLRQKIVNSLKEKGDIKTKEALALVETSDSENLPEESLEIIAESLQQQLNKSPEFAKQIKEETKIIWEKLNKEEPDFFKKIQPLINEVNSIKRSVSYVQEQLKNISVNVKNADYIGRDNLLFAGVQGDNKAVNVGETFNIWLDSPDHKDVNDIIEQIARTRSSITKLIPIEKRLNSLAELRQPKPIFIVERIELHLPFGVTFKFKNSDNSNNQKNQKNQNNFKKENINFVDEDLVELGNIEERLGNVLKEPEKMQKVKRELKHIYDMVNVRIGINNDLFVSLLYPASTCKELVANMVSRIGHKELRDEAEMHFSVISKLVEKLNNLVDKLDVEKLQKTAEINTILVNKTDQNSSSVIKDLIDNLDETNSEDVFKAIKIISSKKSTTKIENNKSSTNQDNNNNIYILTDEAQAAVGMMTEIEQRRLLVERLIRSDRGRQNITITLVTIYIGTVIILTILAFFKYGSNPKFTVGDDLNKSKLAFFGIPWAVALWSLIGSFAAMIYRFNRQPIYDFGDAVKWLLTRPVQGLVLGSAFYLVLTSGLFLLTGGASGDALSGTAKVTTEIILVLSFLVGFSDRFADSVFNALVDRYSKDTKNKEVEVESVKKI